MTVNHIIDKLKQSENLNLNELKDQSNTTPSKIKDINAENQGEKNSSLISQIKQTTDNFGEK